MVLPVVWAGRSAPFVSLSGTITASINETDIVSGAKTIILTLFEDTWIASGSVFNAQRQAILNKLVSNLSEANGWDAELSNLPVTNVVRNSDVQVTITLSALVTYDITEAEVVSSGAPAAALVISSGDLAAGNFTITATSFATSIEWPEGGSIEWPGGGGDITWP